MQLGQPSVDWTMRCPARVKFSSTTADEDETSEGNPGNSNGDAVDVVPPVGMVEPGPRGPVVPSELRSYHRRKPLEAHLDASIAFG